MKAAIIARPGGPEVIEIREVPDPVPQDGEVLIRVRSSALNRADILQREGRYPAPPGAPADIPGLEMAGDVVARGRAARRWREGARLFGIVGGGAHAELVAAHEDALCEVPAALGLEDAGAVPEAFITAYDALVLQAGLVAGETILVHAVASGVGLAAAQLARALGATAYGTSRSPAKLDAARAHGMAHGVALPDGPEPLARRVRELTGGRGVDVVLDLLGGPYARAGAEALATRGRLMLVGSVAGGDLSLPLGLVMRNRLTIRGTVLRSRTLPERVEVTEAFARNVVPLLASGALHAVIDSRFPLAGIVAAHRRLQGNETFGKVAIDVGA